MEEMSEFPGSLAENGDSETPEGLYGSCKIKILFLITPEGVCKES